MPSPPRSRPRFGVAFLLAQLGASATEQFALALTELELTPPLAGILRRLMIEPDLTQQRLAEQLGTAPSRIVGYIDDLESRGWITRTRGTVDRRINVLALTDAGRTAVAAMRKVAAQHEKNVTTNLDDDEHAALLALLNKVATTQPVRPGVHPGYRGPSTPPPNKPTGD